MCRAGHSNNDRHTLRRNVAARRPLRSPSGEQFLAKRDIVAIGGSAGSLSALQQMVSELPATFPASVLVTRHLAPHQPSHFAEVLAESSALPISQALDGQPIERSHVYVSPPDRHLLLLNGAIRLGSGPRENMSRPSIDPMFRSAALAYGPRTVGVVLSGMLNDGASGLRAIKACGGTTIVQHPLDAQSDSMPLAALEATEIDRVSKASDLAATLVEVTALDADTGPEAPDTLALEVSIAAGARLGSDALHQLADPAPLTCPECMGVMSQVRGEQPLRFRCQIGHAHTAQSLAAQNDRVEEAMVIALRVMEERVALVTRMAQDARSNHRNAVAELYEARAGEYAGYAEVLRAAALASTRLGTSERDQER
jgi:two-component system chemotaxis response regulator CheB